MKQRNERVGTAKFLQGLWPGVLMGGLALAGPAAAAQAGASAAAPVADSGTAAHTMYRVINVGPGDAAYAMNERDQVAFTHADPWGPPPSAWFFDGARLHQIPTLGGTAIRTTDVNDLGQVTGISETPNGLIHSFVWSLRNGITDIGTLPGRNTTWEPMINNRGEVTGYSTAQYGPPYPHAIRWSAKSGIEDLGLLLPGDDSTSYGRAINDAGMITGEAWAGGSNYHAFLWTRATGMFDIDTLGARRSYPVAIGAKGQVAGNLLNDPNNYGSVFWWTRATGMRDLGPGNGQGTGMFGMSSGGRIAGMITYPGLPYHAMTWTAEQGMRDLGTLGGSRSSANAANNKGQVVGAALTPPEDRFHAFVWSDKEGMVDLHRRLYRAPAGLLLESAVAISDRGSILVASNAGLVLLKPVQACGCAHGVGPIASASVVQVGAPVDTSIDIANGETAGRYNVTWAWGDGTSDRAREAKTSSGGGSASARHTYSAPGIYTVKANVTDQAGTSATVSRTIVVHEPASGVAGGSGTVIVPPVTAQRSPVAGGMARFSFLVPAAAKGNPASAKGAFMFSVPGVTFASNDVRVFAARGAQVQLVGTGTINGAGSYNFTATAAAGSSDAKAGRFDVKIWHTDPNTAAQVVDYDTQDAAGGNGGRPLAEGSIVVQ